MEDGVGVGDMGERDGVFIDGVARAWRLVRACLGVVGGMESWFTRFAYNLPEMHAVIY